MILNTFDNTTLNINIFNDDYTNNKNSNHNNNNNYNNNDDNRNNNNNDNKNNGNNEKCKKMNFILRVIVNKRDNVSILHNNYKIISNRMTSQWQYVYIQKSIKIILGYSHR